MTQNKSHLTAKNQIVCEGGAPGQHPKLYIKIPLSGKVICLYCAQTFERLRS